MGIFSSIFGGGATGASERTQATQTGIDNETRSYIDKMTNMGRADINKYFGQGQDFRQQGLGNAFNLISGALPQQLNMFNQGNYGAQNQIANTLPQVQNALMGLPVDPNAFQAKQMRPDISFLQNFENIANQNTPTDSGVSAVVPPAASDQLPPNTPAYNPETYFKEVIPDTFEIPVINLSQTDPVPTKMDLISAGMGDRFSTDLVGTQFNLADYQRDGGNRIQGGGMQLTDGQLEELSYGRNIWL